MGKYISFNNVIFIYTFNGCLFQFNTLIMYLNKHIKILAEKIVETVNKEDNDYDAAEEVHDILINEILNTVLRLSVIKYLLKSKFKNENNIRI